MDLTQVGQVVFSKPDHGSNSSAPEFPGHVAIGNPPSSKHRVPINGHDADRGGKHEDDKKHLSITLVGHNAPSQQSIIEHPFLTLYPTSKTTATEWRDALRFLVGLVPGEETEESVRRLADVGLRVKLLDIVAGGVEIPASKPVIEGTSVNSGTAGKVSITGEFWYDSMVD